MSMVFNRYVLDNGAVVSGDLAKVISKKGGISQLSEDELERVKEIAGVYGVGVDPYHLSFVYMIQDDAGAFKVGWSRHPTKRCNALRVSNPHNLRIVAVFAFWGGALNRDEETDCHKKMAEDAGHIVGEWFKGDALDHVDTLAKVCAKSPRYVRLKDAIRKSLEIWPVFMSIQNDEVMVAAAKVRRTEVVSLTKILGKDWEY